MTAKKRKPSEVEVVAMAMWAQGNWHHMAPPQIEWRQRPLGTRAMYRGFARAFLRALRGAT